MRVNVLHRAYWQLPFFLSGFQREFYSSGKKEGVLTVPEKSKTADTAKYSLKSAAKYEFPVVAFRLIFPDTSVLLRCRKSFDIR